MGALMCFHRCKSFSGISLNLVNVLFNEFLINVSMFIKIAIKTILKFSFATFLPKESKLEEYQAAASLRLDNGVNLINRTYSTRFFLIMSDICPSLYFQEFYKLYGNNLIN